MVNKTILTTALLLFLFPFFLFSQENQLADIEGITFSMTPKILENGTITVITFGIEYSPLFCGELRWQNTRTAKNESLSNADSSLNAIKEKNNEIFLIPIKYSFFDNLNFRLSGGTGIYYEYNNLNEKGYFSLLALESLGKDKLNSYTNDFSSHLAGPVLDTSLLFDFDWLKTDLTFSIVPIFYLHFFQKTAIDPLMYPISADISENTWGSPYIFLGVDAIVLKYLNLSLNYKFAKLEKKVINFEIDDNENFVWRYPNSSVITQSLTMEISALLPLGNNLSFQIGYGHIKNFISLNSAKAVEENDNYLILSLRKRAK